MPAPQEILKLVERFDAQSEAYQSGKYNEAQIRAEFMGPFFKVLGGDMPDTNNSGMIAGGT